MALTLGERILKYRAKHDLSQKEFAEIARVSTQTIYSIEKGTQTPGKLTFEKIALLLEEEEGEMYEDQCIETETV